MEQSVSYELGRLLAEHVHNKSAMYGKKHGYGNPPPPGQLPDMDIEKLPEKMQSKAYKVKRKALKPGFPKASAGATCPGGKIRSKGMGRGMGYGKGKGPIGMPVGKKKDKDENEKESALRSALLKLAKGDYKHKGESTDDCISRKIKKNKEHGMKQDQAVAAAHSMCGASKESAITVDVERIRTSPYVKAAFDKEAWIWPAINIAAMAAPFVMDWWQNRKAAQNQSAGTGVGGYGQGAQGYGTAPQQQQRVGTGMFNFRPTSTRSVAQAPYQYGERYASAVDGLVKAAIAKVAQGFTFPGTGPGGAYARPTALPSAYEVALQRAEQMGPPRRAANIEMGPGGSVDAPAVTAATLPMMAAAPSPAAQATPTRRPRTAASGAATARRGTPFNIGAAAGRAHATRRTLASQARNLRRGGMFSGLARSAGRLGRTGALARAGGAVSRLGRFGRIGGLLALGALVGPAVWKGLKGAWAGITGQPLNRPAAAGAQGGRSGPIYSPEELRQFSRLGIDPRAMFGAMDAAGALQAGGALRRAQHQNWLRAANMMMLQGMPGMQ